MQGAEHHDLSDDADYAASQKQGIANMPLRSDSAKESSCSEPDGAEVVYSKENVAIHPSQFPSERISGRLKLIKQGSLFMTWMPYKGHSPTARLTEKDKHLYTIRAVPVTDIRSIRRHTPSLGWQYIIVVMSSGLAHPPLYFYNGGVKEFLATIKQHVVLMRSAEDANVFIVNDFKDPLQKTLSSLELPRAISLACGPSKISAKEFTLNENQDSGVNVFQYHGRPRNKAHDPRDLSIHVLEKFSLVTKFAREATSQLFGEHHCNGYDAIDKRTHIQAPATLDHSKKSSNVAGEVPHESTVASDLEKILCLKHKYSEEAATRVGTFEIINYKEFGELSLVWGKSRQPPLVSEEWITFLDSEGRVTDSKALRKRIFYGGLDHKLRKEVWGLLLGYHSYDSTYTEREHLKSIKKLEYETLKNQWQRISSAQAKRFTKFRERKGLIEKDVVRTDRVLGFYDGDDNPNVNVLRDILLTYSFYNFDLGYCQGMSDLLSPIFYVMADESEAFWCFVALMERLGPNFNRDQNGMHSQLFALSKLVELLDSSLHNYFKQNDCLNYFFCFRWILIQFKREFEYEKTMRLWEVLWTHHLSEHLHLYVCVAILKRHRSKIMGEKMDFDTLLKFINELSGHIDLDATLRDAEALCLCAGENGAAVIPPGTPPSLPVDDGLLLYSQQDEVL
ncbi:TBC1 domain family member 15 [Senna tora]|uniref:TBC1 domain family member 15 n=1 Tax=Senna tora TaxID=362788 RepID=A0A834X5U0_9FABA|nr:TBC1 domain family member 15 [Senna tora]